MSQDSHSTWMYLNFSTAVPTRIPKILNLSLGCPTNRWTCRNIPIPTCPWGWETLWREKSDRKDFTVPLRRWALARKPEKNQLTISCFCLNSTKTSSGISWQGQGEQESGQKCYFGRYFYVRTLLKCIKTTFKKGGKKRSERLHLNCPAAAAHWQRGLPWDTSHFKRFLKSELWPLEFLLLK